ncbi:hypothetical protein ACH5RR_018780 [Cinchona calisaya]|uniref:Uncharacterized protein n=1 Tax=Cinchona calisaya TaxID=153742 RepID=A0ABD2ZP36_9GENT
MKGSLAKPSTHGRKEHTFLLRLMSTQAKDCTVSAYLPNSPHSSRNSTTSSLPDNELTICFRPSSYLAFVFSIYTFFKATSNFILREFTERILETQEQQKTRRKSINH